MDEIITFINRFADAEYEAELAVYGSPDAELNEKLVILDGMPRWEAGDGVSRIGRAPNLPPSELEVYNAQQQSIARRRRFLVRKYQDKKLGVIYRGYLGGPRKGAWAQEYDECSFVQDLGGN